MTKNQLAYYDLVERRRSNLANEGENKRHNIATESFNLSSLAETARHNKANEGFNLSSLAETNRHNREVEKETMRHNITSDGIAQQNTNLAQKRLDFDQEKEVQRIKESLRDFEQNNWYKAGQLLTSRGLTSLFTNSGLSRFIPFAGYFSAASLQGLGNDISETLETLKARARMGAVEARFALKEFIRSAQSFLDGIPMLIFDQQMDLINPITPNGQNSGNVLR